MIRSSLFDLCKSIQKENYHSDLVVLLDELSKNDEIDGRFIYTSPHGGLGSLGATLKKQIWGYLYIDDYYETLPIPEVYSINSHLTNDERYLIESAYLAFESIPRIVANALKHKYPLTESIIDPYKLLRPIDLKTSAESLLPTSILEPIANSIINCSICNYLLSSEFDGILNNLSSDDLKNVSVAVDKEVLNSIGKGPSRGIKNVYYSLTDKQFDAPTVLFATSILFHSVRSIIDIIYHMIYSAMLGGDLFVLNNDNIYSVGPRKSDILFEQQVVHSVDLPILGSRSPVGEIVLVDYDVNDNHFHEFGLVQSISSQFVSEFGANCQFNLLYVDDELNSINRFTNAIIDSLM